MRPKQEDWFFKNGDVSIQVEADIPIPEQTFHENLLKFRVKEPGRDRIRLRHHFSLPAHPEASPGIPVYRNAPWEIYRRGSTWTYLWIPDHANSLPRRAAFFNEEHTYGEIYSPDASQFCTGGIPTLTLFPTDQIILSRIFAARRGILFHASGMVINEHGFIFVGHSGAGKSTIVSLLQNEGEILSDDRVIIRRMKNQYNLFGSWSWGTVAQVSPASAPLKMICILEQSRFNRLVPVTDRWEIFQKLLPFVVKPLATADWWDDTLSLLEHLITTIPVFRMQFDLSGKIADVIRAHGKSP
jgi:hypothetical protein